MASLLLNIALAALLCVFCLEEVKGHGRLREPPSRSIMWRYGFQTPINYNDHEVNCGGFYVHWSINNGQCGVCGDNFLDSQPRDNEGGGKYGRGVIVKEYSQGEVIEAEIEITANHKGFFEFSVCPHNDGLSPASEDCFELLEFADGSGTRWQLNTEPTPKTYTFLLNLPADMTCTQCVFRWYWKAGNNVGTNQQETFMACSDISIGSGGNTQLPPIGGGNPPTTTATRPTTTDYDPTSTGCRAVGVWRTVAGMDNWCVTNCALNYCPSSYCCCGCVDEPPPPLCRAVGVWSSVAGMDDWCITNCALGYCPSSHCCCGC